MKKGTDQTPEILHLDAERLRQQNEQRSALARELLHYVENGIGVPKLDKVTSTIALDGMQKIIERRLAQVSPEPPQVTLTPILARRLSRVFASQVDFQDVNDVAIADWLEVLIAGPAAVVLSAPQPQATAPPERQPGDCTPRYVRETEATAPPEGPSELPPRPTLAEHHAASDPRLVRYGVTWDGDRDDGRITPLLTPMPDGYWTPWHIANATASPAPEAPPTSELRRRHASVLRDYAHNCPDRIDGGPGIEDSLHAGAEALESPQPTSEGLATLVPRCEALMAKWFERAYGGNLHPERSIAYDTCIDELRSVLAHPALAAPVASPADVGAKP